MNRLQGKTALITGGGAGIGAATARCFCAEGAAVMLVDANREALDNTLQQLREAFPDALIDALVADVANASLAALAVAKAQALKGKLDILINNAARRNYVALAEATHEDWQSIFDVNLLGAATYCRAALPLLRLAGNGSIVNVSSCYAVAGRKGMGIYDATKAGQLAMTRTLAHEEAEKGIRVNAICPGSTLTDFHLAKAKASGKSVDQLKSERSTTSLLGRWATPEEIALPILWLASDEASFVTGATLMVDGGLSVM